MLVTGEEILEHADDDRRVLEAAQQYEVRQLRGHGRLIRVLRPYGGNSTSVGDALHRATADLGIEADRRGFEAVAGLAAERGAGWTACACLSWTI